MFHTFTLVHIGFVIMFSALGLKGLLVYKNAIARIELKREGESILNLHYSDLVLVLAILSVVTLDATSVQIIEWGRDNITSENVQWFSFTLFSMYLTAMCCATMYTLVSCIMILGRFAHGMYLKLTANPGK